MADDWMGQYDAQNNDAATGGFDVKDWAAAGTAFMQRTGRAPGYRDVVISPTTGQIYLGIPPKYHAQDGRIVENGWWDEWGKGAVLTIGGGLAAGYGVAALNGLGAAAGPTTAATTSGAGGTLPASGFIGGTSVTTPTVAGSSLAANSITGPGLTALATGGSGAPAAAAASNVSPWLRYGLPAASTGIKSLLDSRNAKKDREQQERQSQRNTALVESTYDPFRGVMHQTQDVAALDRTAAGPNYYTPAASSPYARYINPANRPAGPNDTTRTAALNAQQLVASGDAQVGTMTDPNNWGDLGTYDLTQRMSPAALLARRRRPMALPRRAA